MQAILCWNKGGSNLNQELLRNVQALFEIAPANQSVQCKFPARSRWLIEQLQIPQQDLAQVQQPMNWTNGLDKLNLIKRC